MKVERLRFFVCEGSTWFRSCGASYTLVDVMRILEYYFDECILPNWLKPSGSTISSSSPHRGDCFIVELMLNFVWGAKFV